MEPRFGGVLFSAVSPANAGVQRLEKTLDAGVHRHDENLRFADALKTLRHP
jgi:hypothetical protein